MIDLEEENILIESKELKIFLSMDYLNYGLFVDVYDKRKRKTIVDSYGIYHRETILQLMDVINRPPGTFYKKGGVKYLVRNHDRVIWSDNDIEYYSTARSSCNNPYDTRCKSNSIIPMIRKAWLMV